MLAGAGTSYIALKYSLTDLDAVCNATRRCSLGSNDMRINVVKTKEMVFSFSRCLELAPVSIYNEIVERVTQFKLLGVTLCSDLSRRSAYWLYLGQVQPAPVDPLLHLKRSRAPSADLPTLYKVIIRPVVEYAVPVWHSSLPQYLSKDLKQVQRRALPIICTTR